jgi:hypothetical protein
MSKAANREQQGRTRGPALARNTARIVEPKRGNRTTTVALKTNASTPETIDELPDQLERNGLIRTGRGKLSEGREEQEQARVANHHRASQVVLYLDSSALVKRYVLETGTAAVNLKLAEQEQAGHNIFRSVLSFAEVNHARWKKVKDKSLSSSDFGYAGDSFLAE